MSLNYLLYKNRSYKRQSVNYNKQKGFTLIELMIVIMIVAILAAIAIPSYRRYIVKNAEDESKAQMQQLQIQLERWRSSALNYKNFYPQNGVDNSGNPKFEYNDTDNKTIYVPIGSDSNNYHYKITLVDSSNNSLTGTSSVGRSWKMLAEPRVNGPASNGYKIKMDSTGKRCQSRDSSISITTTGCGTGSESW